MVIDKGSYIRVKNLKEMDNNVAPYIDERMYEFIGQEFEVSNVSYDEGIKRHYMILKDNRFYWVPDWVEVLPPAYRYASLIRLDKEYRG
jgi:hypothetical protein